MMDAMSLMAPDQLRVIIAHAAGLLVHRALATRPHILDALPANASLQMIAEAFCTDRLLSINALRGPGRYRTIAHPRQEFMWLAHTNFRRSMSEIGRFLNNRDHTTVLHGVRAHKRRAGL